MRAQNDASLIAAIIDSGACTSVDGQETFDRAMEQLKIDYLEDMKTSKTGHQFETSEKGRMTFVAVKVPFVFSTRDH